MSYAFNMEPVVRQAGSTVELHDYTSKQDVLPESLITRLKAIFPGDIEPHDAMRIMNEQRQVFDDNEDDAYNYSLFMDNCSLDEIYLNGRGNVSSSLKRIYGHFATWVIDDQLQRQTTQVHAEVLPEESSEQLSVAVSDLGKRATRFLVAIYGEPVTELGLVKEEADTIADTTVDVFEGQVRKLSDVKKLRYRQNLTHMLQGATDEQIAHSIGDVQRQAVYLFFHNFKSRLLTNNFDQAFALTTLQQVISLRRNQDPGTQVSESPMFFAKKVHDTGNIKPVETPRTGISLEDKVVMPSDFLVREADDQSQDWQEKALCAQTDPEAFFPEKGGSTREAKRICSGCEVKDECLKYALEKDERFGIWGGLSERERRRLKKSTAASATSHSSFMSRETVDPIKVNADYYVRHKAHDRLGQLLQIIADDYEDPSEYDDELAFDSDKIAIFTHQAVYGIFNTTSYSEQQSDRLARLYRYFTMEEDDANQKWMYENENVLTADIEIFGLTLDAMKAQKVDEEDATILESCIARLSDKNARSMVANYVAPLPEWLKKLKRNQATGTSKTANSLAV